MFVVKKYANSSDEKRIIFLNKIKEKKYFTFIIYGNRNNTNNSSRGYSTPRRRGNRQAHLNFAPPPAKYKSFGRFESLAAGAIYNELIADTVL